MPDPYANHHAPFTTRTTAKAFLLLDPHLTHPNTHGHHDAFIPVHRALDELTEALSPRHNEEPKRYNVPHREPQHRELLVPALHERKYGTNILNRRKA